jgi:hypothetical protein
MNSLLVELPRILFIHARHELRLNRRLRPTCPGTHGTPLCSDVVDGQLEPADLAQFSGVRRCLVARVAVGFVGLHRGELVGEVAADVACFIGDGGGAVELCGGVVRCRDAPLRCRSWRGFS